MVGVGAVVRRARGWRGRGGGKTGLREVGRRLLEESRTESISWPALDVLMRRRWLLVGSTPYQPPRR